MTKARQTYGQKIKSQLISYKKEIADSFHGRPSEPSAMGPVHSYVSRNLLIVHPDESEINLQTIYRAEADTAIKRGEDIDRIIQQYESAHPGTMDEKSLENCVQRIFGQYYDPLHLLETPRYRLLKAEHRKEIALLEQESQPAAVTKRQIEIKEAQAEIASLRHQLASAKTDIAKILSNQIAEKEQQLKKLSLDREQLIIDTRTVHEKQEEAFLNNAAHLVEIALKKHITELQVWRWIDQCLRNPRGTLTEYYNQYLNNADSKDQDYLPRLVDYIAKNNPLADLFEKLHPPSARIVIKSYLKQKIMKQQIRFAAIRNTELAWHYVCPLTEFGAKATTKEGVKGKQVQDGKEIKSQPPTPRSPRSPGAIKDGDLSPNKKSVLSPGRKGFESGNTTPRVSQLLTIPIEMKDSRPSTPVSQQADSRNSSPGTPATSNSLFKSANEKIEAEYNKLHKLPTLKNVVTHNPLRYISAGLNGAAEVVLRQSSRHPAFKYTTGLFIGGTLVVIAATTTGAVDFVSFLLRSPKTLGKKIQAYRKAKAKKAKNAKEDLPTTPPERKFAKGIPSPRATSKNQIELSVNRPLPISRSPKPVYKSLDVKVEPTLPNAVPLSIEVVDEDKRDRFITLPPTPAEKVAGSQLQISRLLARRLQMDENKEKLTALTSHAPTKGKINAIREHGSHRSIDFRFMSGSRTSLHLDPTLQEQNVLKQTFQTINENSPLSGNKKELKDVAPAYDDVLIEHDAPPSYRVALKASKKSAVL